MSNTLQNVPIERLLQIEQEREHTQGDIKFQKWCKDMRIGIMYKNREGIENANRMMQDWVKREEEMSRWMPDFIRRLY